MIFTNLLLVHVGSDAIVGRMNFVSERMMRKVPIDTLIELCPLVCMDIGSIRSLEIESSDTRHCLCEVECKVIRTSALIIRRLSFVNN